MLILKLNDNLDLRRGEKNVALSNLSIYYTLKNIESLYNNSKFKISPPTWNDKFELPDGSRLPDIQDYCECILKKHNGKIDHPTKKMYANKSENRIIFRIKTGYYLELLTPETVKLLRSTENKSTKDKNGENVPHFETNELVLVHWHIGNNYYQQDSRVLYTFVPNKPFDSLLETSPKNNIYFKNI